MNITEEIIDSFLRGDLSEAEQAAFNKAILADPKLQQEVSIQKDIIDSVKQHRHQQLKDRLNAIDVKPVGIGFFYSPYFKLAASIGVVALLVGSFVWFNNDNKEESAATVESSVTGVELTAKTDEPASIASTETSKPNSESEKIISAPETTTAAGTVTTASTTATVSKTNNKSDLKSQKNASDANFENLSEESIESDNTIDGINDNFDMPAMNHGGNTSSISSPQIKVSIVKENNLGYRFFNNQLFLHGNFSNSTYELFELNNKPSKQLFLYFENNYYELLQGKTKVTSLTPITDKAILLQLTQLREH
jgi:hypothetical protein